MKKISFLVLLLALLAAVVSPAKAEASGTNGMINLWSIRPEGSKSTIGEMWMGMPSYKYTCKSEWIKFEGETKTWYRLIYWPNFYGPGTLVSRDTYCWPTNSQNSWKVVNKLRENLYREIGSSDNEPFLDMVSAFQFNWFTLDNPSLVCKSAAIGLFQKFGTVWKQVRYNRAVFKPSEMSEIESGFLFVTRDLSCTTETQKINFWKREPNWNYITFYK